MRVKERGSIVDLVRYSLTLPAGGAMAKSKDFNTCHVSVAFPLGLAYQLVMMQHVIYNSRLRCCTSRETTWFGTYYRCRVQLGQTPGILHTTLSWVSIE
jgi:hypothetical protein